MYNNTGLKQTVKRKGETVRIVKRDLHIVREVYTTQLYNTMLNSYTPP